MIYHFSPTNNFYLIVFTEPFSKIFEPDPNLNTEAQIHTNALIFRHHFSMPAIDQELKEHIRERILLNPQVQTIMYSVNYELYQLIDKKYPNWKIAKVQAAEKALEDRKRAADALLQKTIAQAQPEPTQYLKPPPFQTSPYSIVQATPPPHSQAQTTFSPPKPNYIPLTTYNNKDVTNFQLFTANHQIYQKKGDLYDPLAPQSSKQRIQVAEPDLPWLKSPTITITPHKVFGEPPPQPPPEPNPDQYKQILRYERKDVTEYQVYLKAGNLHTPNDDGTFRKLPTHRSDNGRYRLVTFHGKTFNLTLILTNIPYYLSSYKE